MIYSMNEQAAILGYLVLAAGGIVACFKFWIDIGKNTQQILGNSEAIALITAKQDLLASVVGEFKTEVAKTYATARELSEAEHGLATAMRESIQGIYNRLDAVTQRLDSLLTIARHPHDKS